MDRRTQQRMPSTQIALVDALTWDCQTIDELADQVWSWIARVGDRHPNRGHISPLISLLRRRGIAIENVGWFGYRFAEDR